MIIFPFNVETIGRAIRFGRTKKLTRGPRALDSRGKSPRNHRGRSFAFGNARPDSGENEAPASTNDESLLSICRKNPRAALPLADLSPKSAPSDATTRSNLFTNFRSNIRDRERSASVLVRFALNDPTDSKQLPFSRKDARDRNFTAFDNSSDDSYRRPFDRSIERVRENVRCTSGKHALPVSGARSSERWKVGAKFETERGTKLVSPTLGVRGKILRERTWNSLLWKVR